MRSDVTVDFMSVCEVGSTFVALEELRVPDEHSEMGDVVLQYSFTGTIKIRCEKWDFMSLMPTSVCPYNNSLL